MKLPLVTPIYKDTVYTWTYSSGLVNQTGMIYIDNLEYQITSGMLQSLYLLRMHNPEGYADNVSINPYGPFYYYYHKDHLGNIREVWRALCMRSGTNIAANTDQQTQYYPSGLPWTEGTGASFQPNKFNGKEFDEMNGYDTYDYGARGYYAASGRFTSVDPLAEKYYSISPYAYCGGDPVNRIDPSGMSARTWDQNESDANLDEYIFDGKGVYDHKVKKVGESYGKIVGNTTHKDLYFKFADPVNDPKTLDNTLSGDAQAIFEDDSAIQNLLDDSGVNDHNNQGLVRGTNYLLKQSNGNSLTGGKMDYVTNLKNHIDTFLWGAGANALGISETMAKMGAQFNNYFLDSNNKGTFDSVDDQFSIGVGYNWKNNSISTVNPILIYGIYGAAYLKLP